MDGLINTAGTNGIPYGRDPISVWSICLPFDYDRAEYIKTCYLTGTVIVSNDNGEQNKAKIGKLALQLAQFPLSNETVGSQVACISTPYGDQLYVVDVYSKSTEFEYQSEDQFKLEKHNDTGCAELSIDGNGIISLSVQSFEEKGGVVNVNITNASRTGKLNLIVNGQINIQNDGDVVLKTTKQILIDSPKILLNDSEEPVLLGQKVVDFLTEWLDILGKD
jgi:hypothetical protein